VPGPKYASAATAGGGDGYVVDMVTG